MDSGDIPKDLFEGLDGSSKSPPRAPSPPSTTTEESVQLSSTPPINIITNPALQEEDVIAIPREPTPRLPLPPPIVAPDAPPVVKPKSALGTKKFGKTKWQNLQRQVLQAAQEQSVINPPPPVPVSIEKGATTTGTVFPVVVPTHTTHQPALVVPCEPVVEPKIAKVVQPKPFPGKATKKLSFLSVVQAARAKAKEGLQDVLDTGAAGGEGIVRGEEGIVRGEVSANVVRVPSPPHSPAQSSYTRFVNTSR